MVNDEKEGCSSSKDAYAKESTTTSETKRELEALLAVQGAPGTVQIHDHFQHFETSCSGSVVYIVTDLMSGRDLDGLLTARGSFVEDDVMEIMRQVFTACAELHERGVVHRDIKLENVMLSDEHVYHKGVKLIDFGLSVCLQGRRQRLKRCGTPFCIAPEVIGRSVYGCEVDIWSCGVMMYSLLCGFPPFYSSSMTVLFRKISNRALSYSDPAWYLISEGAIDLINRCLTVDPDVRITARDALNHPWMLGEPSPSGLPSP
eukprot:scaffold287019_cov45-Prasinocladus_malaysianus.AAC.1